MSEKENKPTNPDNISRKPQDYYMEYDIETAKKRYFHKTEGYEYIVGKGYPPLDTAFNRAGQIDGNRHKKRRWTIQSRLKAELCKTAGIKDEKDLDNLGYIVRNAIKKLKQPKTSIKDIIAFFNYFWFLECGNRRLIRSRAQRKIERHACGFVIHESQHFELNFFTNFLDSCFL